MVVQARGLPPAGFRGCTNAFAELRCGAHPPVRTRVVRNSRFPIWAELFQFELPDVDGAAALGLQLFDDDLIPGCGDFIGQVGVTSHQTPDTSEV
jgi:hypothetical protein